MKNVMLFTALLCLSSFALRDSKASLKGKILDKETQLGLISAEIVLYKDDVFITGMTTDYEGNFSFSNLDPGIYDVEAKYIGYKSERKDDVVLSSDKVTQLKIELTVGGPILDEVVIKDYKRPIVKKDYSSTGKILSKSDISSLPTKNISALASTACGVKSSDRREDVLARTSRSDAKSYYVDGIRVSEEGYELTDLITTSESAKEKEANQRAGQLTAGEWNDLHQWEDWKKLISEDVYKNMSNTWKISPRERYSVMVTNKSHQPIPNAKVTLYSTEEIILWEAITDNSGKAELWNGVFTNDHEALSIEANVDGKSQTINSITEIAEGSNHIIFDIECKKINNLEVMFVVDATGSMGDEIHFLKAEITDVINSVQSSNEDLFIKTGSVFYRDTRDKYLTRVSDLTENLETTTSFISVQSAEGGGDEPEAVEAGLQEALKQNWTFENTSRIIFLVLDAPPHRDENSLKSIQKHIKKAAALGIKIIPITASGLQRPAEFLMKYMAILTNGTYVFITDDSGIGNGHLAPVVDDYEVEKLNALMIRLLTQFSKDQSCAQEIIKEKIDFKVFPNPSSEFIFIQLKNDVNYISIHSSSGMEVLRLNNVDKGKERIDISNLVAGMYTIKIVKDDIITTKTFVKVQ